MIRLLGMVRHFLQAVWELGGAVVRRCSDDEVAIMAAALAYYAFLAVIPLLLLGLSVADHALGSSEGFYEHAARALRGLLPIQSLEELDRIAREFTQRRKLITGVGLLALVWIAMRIFDVLERELNLIWGAKRRRGWVARKALSLAAFALAVVLFLLSVGTTWLAAAKGRGATAFGINISELPLPWHALTAATPVLLSVLMFLCLYTMLPNTKVSRRYALLGAVLAATTWELTKVVFQHCASYYPTYDRFYGSLAGVTILVLWLYLTGFALLLGAEVAVVCQENDADLLRSPGALAGDRYVPQSKEG